jgi:hypothetical protein
MREGWFQDNQDYVRTIQWTWTILTDSRLSILTYAGKQSIGRATLSWMNGTYLSLSPSDAALHPPG